MKCISDKLCRETQNTNLIFNEDFLEYLAVYEIMRKIL
jgi:hypothetical protein